MLFRSQQIKVLQDLADQLAKAKSGSPEADKLEKQVLSTQKSIDSALKALDDMKDVRERAGKVIEDARKYNLENVLTLLPKMAQGVTAVKSAIAFIKAVAGPMKTIIEGIKKIADAKK